MIKAKGYSLGWTQMIADGKLDPQGRKRRALEMMNIWVMMQKTTLFLPVSLETIVLCKEKCNSVSRGCNIWSCNTDSDHDYIPAPIYSVPPPVQFSSSVMSESLLPRGLQHARPPCPSPTPGVYSNSCPLSWWCHPTIILCHPLLLLPSIFPSIRVFSNESALRIRWPKYWSFSFNISPSNKHPGPISYRMEWLDLLAV